MISNCFFNIWPWKFCWSLSLALGVQKCPIDYLEWQRSITCLHISGTTINTKQVNIKHLIFDKNSFKCLSHIFPTLALRNLSKHFNLCPFFGEKIEFYTGKKWLQSNCFCSLWPKAEPWQAFQGQKVQQRLLVFQYL